MIRFPTRVNSLATFPGKAELLNLQIRYLFAHGKIWGADGIFVQ